MDFYKIQEKETNRKDQPKELIIYPNFQVAKTKDLMVRGKSFYAIWDDNKQIWSTNEYDVQRLVDEELYLYAQERQRSYDGYVFVKYLKDFSSHMWEDFQKYVSKLSDSSHQLDEKVTFLNDDIRREDHVSKRLPYSLEKKDTPAYNELVTTLYDPEEREKFEWAIGSIIAGDSKYIQKFIVFYGEAGSGKSTMLNIIQQIFAGYYSVFEAKALTGSNNQFSTAAFKDNPMVGIQHDGDLSRIEDNTKLNSIISHEEMIINEKHKASYSTRINCFLFMGTNQPVKITDAKSGLLRRLIDVSPSGRKLSVKRYDQIINRILFEIGGIAQHCLDLYLELGRDFYNSYRPFLMMQNTDIFFNFVEENYFIFRDEDGVTLKRAWDMYKEYCEDASVPFKLSKMKFKYELRNYFQEFNEREYVEGERMRNYYSGFLVSKFTLGKEEEDNDILIDLDVQPSLFDEECADLPAQYATETGAPEKKWEKVKTKLKDLDTSRLHYVLLDEGHIVIDFDIKDASGEKNLEKNLKEALKWPLTYTEVSKSGKGIHLHYIYDGDPTLLSRQFDKDIEVKVFTGNASLRRQLTKCNNLPTAHISSGLPMKGEKMINFEGVKSEKKLRELIERNLAKEIHAGTKPSVDFIFKILDDAYHSDLKYDVTDMRPKILAFANNSTNQSAACVETVSKMQFKSDEISPNDGIEDDSPLIFFDVEVFPNLFVVVWKKENGAPVKMINPTSKEIEELLTFKLVGFNCRRYDNHILYARYMGYSNKELFVLSQRIINGSKNCMFGEAYNISYTDVYDFASAVNKKSLKKWEIDLDIHHQELGLPWNKPVDESLWNKVADYCVNDVVATEAVFKHLSGDWAARQILAELSGMSVNDTTNTHTTRIVFGKDKNTQGSLVYTDLNDIFPGYEFDHGKSIYKGIEVGEGGYVYAEPGMYGDVALLDISSMHPTSIVELNLLGPYTKNFEDLKEGRVAIKRGDTEKLKTILGGKFIPFLEDVKGNNPKFTLTDVSNGLKTAINSVYGLTSAHFENPFKDPRNKDNIVAKRGALFMVELQLAVQEKGWTVAHIKTDSIKIPDANQEIIDFIFEMGKKYGYEFEHEATYNKFCLLNDSTYVAFDKNWTATGTQLIHPYVFKKLFSKDDIQLKDMIEARFVKVGNMVLDMNEKLKEGDHDYHFIGKAGCFCPIKPGKGGGELLRENEEKYTAIQGTKGYRWLEYEMVKEMGLEDDIDISYFNNLADKAFDAIAEFGDAEWFVSNAPYEKPPFEGPYTKGEKK